MTKREEEIKLVAEVHGIEEASKRLGVKPASIERVLRMVNQKAPPKEKLSTDFNDDSGKIQFQGKGVKTIDDVLARAEIDTDIWEVERVVCNQWDVSAKYRDTNLEWKDGRMEGHSIHRPEWNVNTNYQIKVWLKRKLTKSQKSHLDNVLERMKDHAPKYKKIKRKVIDNPHMLEIALFDAHFGKLAWGGETLEDYDCKIASELYMNACKDLLDRAAPFNVDRILFPIGHDLFHMNDATGCTPKGNNQLDIDNRLGKVIDIAQEAVVKAIDLCRNVAPVDIVFIPGNHDPDLARMFALTIKAWYRNCDDVTVDSGCISRKYYRYGTLLLGMTHRARFKGGGLSPERLLGIMATEAKQDWADTKWHEWHLGDQHRKIGASFMDNLEELGVRVRWLPSLNGQDKWHFDEGYVLQRRAAECYLWNKESGYTGHFSVEARGSGGSVLNGDSA